MKSALLVAVTAFGAVSFASASLAQGDAGATLSRAPQTGAETGVMGRVTMPGPAAELEPSRPAAGMLPQPPSGRLGNYSASETAPVSRDLRNGLRRE